MTANPPAPSRVTCRRYFTRTACLPWLLSRKLRVLSQETCKYFRGVCVVEAVKPVLRSACDSEVCDVSQARYECLISLLFKKKTFPRNS